MRTFIIAVGIAVFPLLSFAKEKEEKAPVPNATLADVRFGVPVNDVPFSKDALAGKVVVVEEWGVNCGTCIATMPDLAKMAKSGEKKGLVVVGLECQNSSKEDILKVLKATRVGYAILSGGSAPASTGGLPHACVFDTTGKLVWAGSPTDEEFERAVKKELRAIKK